MSKINDGGPAFPQAATVGPQGDIICGGHYFSDVVGTLRDYFAAKAIVPLLTDATLPTKADRDKYLPMLAERRMQWPMPC